MGDPRHRLTVPCPHTGPGQTLRVCVHLLANEYLEFCRRYTGFGFQYDLVCQDCRKHPEQIDASLGHVCAICFDLLQEEGDWLGVLGCPEVRERPTGLRFSHRRVSLRRPLGEIADLKPVIDVEGNLWMALCQDGSLVRLDLQTGEVATIVSTAFAALVEEAKVTVTSLASTALAGLAKQSNVALHVAPRGELAAVVCRRGQRGSILATASGEVTMPLTRGRYHVEYTTFPCAFFEMDGRLLLVHGTNWNRLDVSDPWTGELLTKRSPTSYKQGEPRPPHYLDYFHSGVVVSPDHEWIVDNGWVWHPWGIVKSWSLRRWLTENVWESEDGPTKRHLCDRSYFWDGPLCWIDGRTLAVWGYGNDDENIFPAARIFDVVSGSELRWFPGPYGTLVFDRWLYAFAPESGASVWDVETGERLLHDPSFCPTAYHHGARCFVTVEESDSVMVSILEGDVAPR
jgi:hypothetical protein